MSPIYANTCPVCTYTNICYRYLRLPLAIYHPSIAATLDKTEARGPIPELQGQQGGGSQSQKNQEDSDGVGLGVLTGEGISPLLGDKNRLKKLPIQPE